MDRWKSFFQSSGFDLWTICERALTIAYHCNPEDFPLQRDKLSQKLFAPEKLDIHACDNDAPVFNRTECFSQGDANRSCISDGPLKADASSPVEQRLLNCDRSYDEAELLTEEMEEESLVKRAVLSIKESFQDLYLPEKEILDALQRLHLMQLSVEVLQDTGIGVTVNSLRRHSSQRVRSMSKQLVSGWKDLVEEWVRSAADFTASATTEAPVSDSPNSVNEDHGLPSPPMDEGALLAAVQTSPVEMSQLFDFMDDLSTESDSQIGSKDDQPACTMQKEKICGGLVHGRLNPPDIKVTLQQSTLRDKRCEPRPERNAAKQRESLNSFNGYSEKQRPSLLKSCSSQINNGSVDVYVESKTFREKMEKKNTRNIPSSQPSKPGSNTVHNNSNLDYIEKLQAAKRKLQQNYQQADLVKKQRTIQVMNFQNLRKGGPNRVKTPSKTSYKPVSQHWALGTGRK